MARVSTTDAAAEASAVDAGPAGTAASPVHATPVIADSSRAAVAVSMRCAGSFAISASIRFATASDVSGLSSRTGFGNSFAIANITAMALSPA